jgi:hypothetical protein
MQPFRGTRTDEQGKLSIPVFGEGGLTSAGGMPGWEGWVQNANPGQGLSLGDYYLTLDDGRRGAIGIRGMRQTASSAPVCTFRGYGPPPA